MLPPVEIDGEHFFDGGLVNSIPVDRAVRLGAELIYVLQVGRIEQPLSVPTKPWEVGLVAFEIARRHRFAEEIVSLPSSVTVHVLPTGEELRYNDLRQQLRYSDLSQVGKRMGAPTRRAPPSSPSLKPAPECSRPRSFAEWCSRP